MTGPGQTRTSVPPSAVETMLEHVPEGADIIVPMANGEPVGLLDVIEANADRLERVKVHRLHALHDRRYLHGAFGDRLRYISHLSDVTYPCFKARTIDLGPNNFSEMRDVLLERSPSTVTATSASGWTPTTSRRSSGGHASSSRPTRRRHLRSVVPSCT